MPGQHFLLGMLMHCICVAIGAYVDAAMDVASEGCRNVCRSDSVEHCCDQEPNRVARSVPTYFEACK